MKEIKQYLVVYWTLTKQHGILRNFVLKQIKHETNTLCKQNLEEKMKKKQRKQIRLDSKFLYILPRSTRSPKQTNKKKQITKVIRRVHLNKEKKELSFAIPSHSK